MSIFTDLSYKIPVVGNALELSSIYNDYNKNSNKIKNKEAHLKAIRNDLKCKKSSQLITEEEKYILDDKINKLSGSIAETNSRLVQEKKHAIFKGSGVIMQETANAILPGSGPLVAGALSATEAVMYKEASEEDSENQNAVTKGSLAAAKDYLYSLAFDTAANSCSVM